MSQSDPITWAVRCFRTYTKFQRIRYWDVVDPPWLLPTGDVTSRPYLQLVHYDYPEDSEPPPDRYVLSIDDTTLRPPYVLHVLSVRTGHTPSVHDKNLGLVDKSWIELPIAIGPILLGEIAADWDGEPPDLDKEDLLRLSLFGRLLAAQIFSSRKSAQSDRTGRPFALGLSSDALATDFLSAAMTTLDARVAALFRYHVQTGRLCKIAETFADPRDTPDEQLPEEYATGDYFTGRAWRGPEARYIPDLRAFLELSHTGVRTNAFIYDRSVQWHKAAFRGTDIDLVHYIAVGESPRKYMVRFINRRVEPDIGWYTRRQSVSEIEMAFGRQVDRTQQREFERAVQQLNTGLLDPRVHTPPDITLAEAMRVIGIESFMVLIPRIDMGTGNQSHPGGLRSHSQEPFNVVSRGPHGWQALAARLNLAALTPRSLQGDTISEALFGEIPFVRTASHAELVAFQGAHIHGATHCLVIRIEPNWQRPILLVPLLRPNTYSLEDLDRELRVDQSPWVSAITELFSSYTMFLLEHALEIAPAYSLNAFRYLQHELGEPLASFGRDAQELLYDASKVYAQASESGLVQRHLPHKYGIQISKLSTNFVELRRVFEDMPILGYGGEVQLHLQSGQRIGPIIADSMERVRRRFPVSLRLRYDIPPFEFAVDVTRVPRTYTLDREHITQALVCILDNAVKYSMPGARGDEESAGFATIGIAASESNSLLEIRVSNFGYAIPNVRDEPGRIVKPFARGNVRSQRRAIPGMGLGLYFAHTLAEAHGGRVALVQHTSTFGDQRRRNVEGWRTAFALVVSAALEPGIVTVTPAIGEDTMR